MNRLLAGCMIALCSCSFPHSSGDEVWEALLFYNLTRTTSQTKFVYVQNLSATGGISMYSVHKTTGVLTQFGTLAAAPTPGAPVLDAQSRFAFLFVGTTLSSYKIDPDTGNLTLTGSIASGTNPSGVRVDPSGRFLFFVSGATGIVSAYAIDQTSGSLSAVNTQTTGFAAFGNPIIHPAGSSLYLAADAFIFHYSIDSSTGALGLVGTVANGAAAPGGLSLGGSGRFLFHAYAGGVRVFTTGASGELTLSGTSAGFAGASGINAEHPSGRFGYMTNIAGAGNTVYAYTIDQTSGLLTSAGTIAAGTNTGVVRVEPKGRYAYVSNRASNDIYAYAIDPVSGALSLISSHACGGGVLLASIDPTARFLYAPGSAGTTLSAFNINGDGTLSLSQTATAGNNPIFAALVNFQQWPAVD